MSKQININYLAWRTISWPLVEKRVRRVQRRIYKASLAGNVALVRWLQYGLINSLDAKYLSVRLVTTLNKGRRTPGVDKKRITNDRQKEILAKKLKLDGKALPIRRVWIPKPGKSEKRPLGIPSIKDRAKQALAKYALEPEWEAKFEPNSYGFRPGRRTHDAIEAIFLSLRHKRPKWVFDADIRKCFDTIDHEALISKLDTFPQMAVQVKAWLQASIMEGYASAPKSITPSTMGTPQGGIISPLLANIALHGLELHLKNFVACLDIKSSLTANRGKVAKQKALSIIRYADDFVLIHENKMIIDLCILETQKWLVGIGLELSKEKSELKPGTEDFLFLGFQIIQVRKNLEYKVKIVPSKAKVVSFLQNIRDIIKKNRAASAFQLIRKLRPVIIGWANYYKFCECASIFSKLTHLIFQKIRAWAFRRDTRNGRIEIKSRYFPSGKEYAFDGTIHKDNWILYGTEKCKKTGRLLEAFLPHIVWVRSKKYVKVQGTKSPFDGDFIYWNKKQLKRGSLSLRVSTLLKKQKNVCLLCKIVFTSTDTMEVDHIIPKFKGGIDSYINLQLLHRACHVTKTATDLSSP